MGDMDWLDDYVPETVEDGDEDAPFYAQKAYDAPSGLSWLAKAVDGEEDGPSRFVASTGDVDRHGDIVEQSFRLAAWRANPVILYEHSYPVVGRGTAKIATSDSGAKALGLSVVWHESPVNPMGMLAAEQHRLGFRSAVSIGFIPGETTSRTKLPEGDPRKLDPGKVPEWQAGRVYRFNELLEVSSVAVPANAKALQARAYAQEVEGIEDQVRRYLQEASSAKVRGLLTEMMRHNPAVTATLRSMVLGSTVTPKNQEATAFYNRGAK